MNKLLRRKFILFVQWFYLAICKVAHIILM